MTEFLAGVEVTPHFQPAIDESGGDCYVCSLTSALRHVLSNEAIDPDNVFEWFRRDDGTIANTWWGMQEALHAAKYDHGLPIEFVTERVMPEFPDGLRRCGYQFALETDDLRYCRRLEAYLRAGWLALTEITLEPCNADLPGAHYTDHFVVLDGVRVAWIEHEDLPASALKAFVHWTCSARKPRWVNAREMLAKHGGAAWILVRHENHQEGPPV